MAAGVARMADGLVTSGMAVAAGMAVGVAEVAGMADGVVAAGVDAAARFQ